MPQSPLGKRAFATLLIVLAILGAAGLACYAAIQRYKQTLVLVVESRDFLQSLEQTLGLLKDAETGQRGYLLTAAPQYLEPYNRARRSIGRSIGQLRSTADSDEALPAVDSLASVAGRKLDELARTIVLAEHGRRDSALSLVLGGRGTYLMDSARMLERSLRESEQARLASREVAAARSGNLALASIVLGTLLALAIGFVAGRDVSHELARREAAAQQRVAAAEANLATSSRTLGAIVASSPLAIITVDTAGVVTSWNRGAERTFGWTAAEAVGGPTPFVPPERQHEFDDRLAAVLRGEIVETAEVERVRKDGRPIRVSLSVTPLVGPGGHPDAVLALCADVTERATLSAQLHQAQRLDAIGRLASGIAHDFNNLLTAMLGFSEMLRDSLPADDVRRESAEQIIRAAERAGRLTRQLLAFSRRQVLVPIPLDIGAAIRELEPILQRLVPANVVIEVHDRADQARALADPGQLEQVLLNLVINARDAQPNGGRIVVEIARTPHGTSNMAAGPCLRVTVRDDGIGMDEETRRRIFEPFFTTKAEGENTGLGLATVYGIVRQLGGDVDVRSAPGEGATFSIYLPHAEATPAAAPTDGTPAALDPTRHDATILVVDADESVRALAEAALAHAGFRVALAADGASALAAGAAHRPNLVLIVASVVLPGMSGVDVAETLRRLRPGLKILFVSGSPENAARVQGLMARNEVAFLEKPFGGEELVLRVRQLLATR